MYALKPSPDNAGLSLYYRCSNRLSDTFTLVRYTTPPFNQYKALRELFDNVQMGKGKLPAYRMYDVYKMGE